jgi:hypothetical protein
MPVRSDEDTETRGVEGRIYCEGRAVQVGDGRSVRCAKEKDGDVTGCVSCGRRLWFSERVAFPSEFCFGCAQARCLIRVADHTRLRNLHTRAAKLPRWWQWTVFVEHAVAWGQR